MSGDNNVTIESSGGIEYSRAAEYALSDLAHSEYRACLIVERAADYVRWCEYQEQSAAEKKALFRLIDLCLEERLQPKVVSRTDLMQEIEDQTDVAVSHVEGHRRRLDFMTSMSSIGHAYFALAAGVMGGTYEVRALRMRKMVPKDDEGKLNHMRAEIIGGGCFYSSYHKHHKKIAPVFKKFQKKVKTGDNPDGETWDDLKEELRVELLKLEYEEEVDEKVDGDDARSKIVKKTVKKKIFTKDDLKIWEDRADNAREKSDELARGLNAAGLPIIAAEGVVFTIGGVVVAIPWAAVEGVRRNMRRSVDSGELYERTVLDIIDGLIERRRQFLKLGDVKPSTMTKWRLTVDMQIPAKDMSPMRFSDFFEPDTAVLRDMLARVSGIENPCIEGDIGAIVGAFRQGILLGDEVVGEGIDLARGRDSEGLIAIRRATQAAYMCGVLVSAVSLPYLRVRNEEDDAWCRRALMKNGDPTHALRSVLLVYAKSISSKCGGDRAEASESLREFWENLQATLGEVRRNRVRIDQPEVPYYVIMRMVAYLGSRVGE